MVRVGAMGSLIYRRRVSGDIDECGLCPHNSM